MRKISIVTAYYNRLPLLEFTLQTIQDSKYPNFEIVIVDDASSPEHNPQPLLAKYPNLDIKLIKVQNKQHINSCAPYNLGFQAATGDIIIIQNPECCHIGDVISYTADNLQPNQYLSFTCANLQFPQYNNTLYNTYNQDPNKVLSYIQQLEQQLGKGPSCWYNHPQYRPCAYHFLTAINRSDLDKLGGFDQRYAYGSGYDDNEFVERIKHANIDIIFIPPTQPFATHQWHQKTSNFTNLQNVEKNRIIFNNHMKELGIDKFFSHI